MNAIFEIHESATTEELRTVRGNADTIAREFSNAMSHYAADSSVFITIIAIVGTAEIWATWSGDEESPTWESCDWDACARVMELMGTASPPN